MSVTRKWSLLAAVLVLAILAAGWFLLIAPKRSEASGLRAQAATQQDANARLLQQLAVLKAQQAELPEQRAKLAVMRTQIPDNPALPTLIRDLTAAGRKVGVSIDAMAPSTPAAVAVVQPAPVTTTSSSGGRTAAPVAAAPALYQVPLALNVTGSYFELEQFINKLEGLKRSFLVSGFSLAPAGGGDGASSATDGPAPGDLTLALQGRVYLAPAAASAAAPPTPAASPATGQ